MRQYDVIIVGGGAAGFFTAINIATLNSNLNVAIIERAKAGLQKVRISGGGRCNVTHAEFIPSELVNYYPRGKKELLGPFHNFMTGDTVQWFEDRGIELKTEDDGRMFPVSNSSQTIIDCFLDEAKEKNVEVLYNYGLRALSRNHGLWHVQTTLGDFECKKVVIATGSSQKIWDLIENLGHSIIKAVPSLFTFNIIDERITSIPGVVVERVTISVKANEQRSDHLLANGPLLVTHWGLSGPAILKLSAFGAKKLATCNYKFSIEINFINLDKEECLEHLRQIKISDAKKKVIGTPQFNLPKRLWNNLVHASDIGKQITWADLNKSQLNALSEQLTMASFHVSGKSTYKEEFVTAGGVDLKEVDFRNFESKLHESMFFAGEVLNIDAVTGGFNFQNAWTGGFIVARAIANSGSEANMVRVQS